MSREKELDDLKKEIDALPDNADLLKLLNEARGLAKGNGIGYQEKIEEIKRLIAAKRHKRQESQESQESHSRGGKR